MDGIVISRSQCHTQFTVLIDSSLRMTSAVETAGLLKREKKQPSTTSPCPLYDTRPRPCRAIMSIIKTVCIIRSNSGAGQQSLPVLRFFAVTLFRYCLLYRHYALQLAAVCVVASQGSFQNQNRKHWQSKHWMVVAVGGWVGGVGGGCGAVRSRVGKICVPLPLDLLLMPCYLWTVVCVCGSVGVWVPRLTRLTVSLAR